MPSSTSTVSPGAARATPALMLAAPMPELQLPSMASLGTHTTLAAAAALAENARAAAAAKRNSARTVAVQNISRSSQCATSLVRALSTREMKPLSVFGKTLFSPSVGGRCARGGDPSPWSIHRLASLICLAALTRDAVVTSPSAVTSRASATSTRSRCVPELDGVARVEGEATPGHRVLRRADDTAATR